MVKRFSWNSYIYLFFAFLILLVSWEHNRSMAAVVDSDIPKDSIRLRILANSDSVQDQALKRHVRDAIVEQMNAWVLGPATLEEAREIVKERLPELEETVGREMARYGYDYPFHVELGIVPFPAKMYGNKVYPAGDYEALRVTIGQGAGQNWWCVLFPPLCFVESASGEAVAKDAGKEVGKPKKSISASGKKTTVQSDSGLSKLRADGEAGTKKKVVRFYLWDKVKSWFA